MLIFMLYKITNLFPILNYGKSVAQADLFKLQCVKRVILQSLVINTDSDAYAFWVVSLCTDHVISKNKKCKQKKGY